MSATLQREFYTQEATPILHASETVDQGYPLLNAPANTRTTNVTANKAHNRLGPDSIGTVYAHGQYWIQFTQRGVVKYMGRNGAIQRFDVMQKFSRVGKGLGWNYLGGNVINGGLGNYGPDSNQGLFDSAEWYRAVNSNPALYGY
jgi:hypothetical protein